MKWSVFAVAALAIAAIVLSRPAGGSVAVAATPTPAALQYDEITKIIVPTASPPPPGSFAADYPAALAASSQSTPQPPHGGLGMLNPFAQAAMERSMVQMMQSVRSGKVVRYAYYKGWIRRDDPGTRTATIEKCDQHQYIKLDLANKTYTIVSSMPACPTPTSPMGGPPTQATSESPGTVDISVKSNDTNLGPLTIDGIATTGIDRSVNVSMANATGSCRNADVDMSVKQYVSSIPVPHRYCPLPHVMTPMEIAGAMHGGCKPTFQGQASNEFGAELLGSGLTGGKLVMFSSMSLGGQSPGRMGGTGIVIERGNVQWLSGSAAAALFTVPSDFTQAPAS